MKSFFVNLHVGFYPCLAQTHIEQWCLYSRLSTDYSRFPCKTHEHCPLLTHCHIQFHLAVLLLLSGVMTTSEQSQCSTPEGCLGPAASIRFKDYCYSAQTRSTVLQGLPFGGVPTVLVLNFICFLVSRPGSFFVAQWRFWRMFCTCRHCCFCSPSFER